MQLEEGKVVVVVVVSGWNGKVLISVAGLQVISWTSQNVQTKEEEEKGGGAHGWCVE